jgi:hypothetical protein
MSRQSFTLAMAVSVTLLAYLAALAVGPLPVHVGLQKTSKFAQPTYLATVGLPVGILLAEALIDFRKHGLRLKGIRIFILLMLLTLVMFFTKDPKVIGLNLDTEKYLLAVPISGHALILVHFLLHELREQREGRRWKLLAGSVVMLQSVIFKLVIWQDPASFVVGSGLGTVVWICELGLMRLESRTG